MISLTTGEFESWKNRKVYEIYKEKLEITESKRSP